jgi:hypothetical protein
LAENLFEGLNLDTIYSVIRKGENKDAISTLMNYLINNYYVEIYMTPENKKFYLTDNPVIVNDISNIDYFLPLSPNVAMVLKKITSEAINIQVLPVATARMVDGVNSYLIQKAERIIIVQDMTDDDFKYINKIRKRE